MSKSKPENVPFDGGAIMLQPDGQFLLVATENTYESLKAARDARERFESQQKKIARLSLPGIATRIEPYGDGVAKITDLVITGVHAGNGNVTTSPRIDGYSRGDLYPDHPNIRRLIAYVSRVTKHERAMREKLRSLQLDTYHRGELPDAYKTLQSQHENKLAKASKLEFTELLPE